MRPILAGAGCKIFEPAPVGAVDITEVETSNSTDWVYNRMRTLSLDNFDAILSIGGDGSIHQVINGLAMRTDDALKRLAIGTIPAGNSISLKPDIRIWYTSPAI